MILSEVSTDESDLVVWTKQEWSDRGIRNQASGVVRDLASCAVKLEFALSDREPAKGFIQGELKAAY